MLVKIKDLWGQLKSHIDSGKCDNLSDDGFTSVTEDFIAAYIEKNGMGYGVAADKLGISVTYLTKIISDNSIEPIKIRGNTQKILMPSHLKKIEILLSNTRRRK